MQLATFTGIYRIPNLGAGKITSGTFGADRLPTISIAKGGTGQTGITTTNTISQIITPASGVTINSASYSVWGKVAYLYITFQRTSAIAANGTATVGTVAAGKRPLSAAHGGSNRFSAEIAQTGSVGVRNITGGNHAANNNAQIEFCYLLP